MEQSSYIVLLITTPTVEEAQRISSTLLNQKKAACVNIISPVHSLFWWQNKIDSARESLLIVKTKASLLDEVTTLVKENHSYTIPEVIALPIIGGNQDYLDWLEKSVEK